MRQSFQSRDDWRAWLAENHATAQEIWLVIRKKHVAKAAVREDVTVVPPELTAALADNAQARDHFEKLAPSHRKQFIYWISTAKREETHAKRIKTTIKMLMANRKLGLDSPYKD